MIANLSFNKPYQAGDSKKVNQKQDEMPESLSPLWPDYFARHGQSDATTWHYQGYWKDTLRVWRAYFEFLFSHPIKTFLGQRQFFRTLAYRIFSTPIGDGLALPIGIVTPALMLTAPMLAACAVAIAKIPLLNRLTPPLFHPFTFLGWTNYCVMLILVFTWHGYRQYKKKLHPMQAGLHSSKIFWNDFFADQLPQGHHQTKVLATYRAGRFNTRLPQEDIVLKPEFGGAGYKLHSFKWNSKRGTYKRNDIEMRVDDPCSFTPYELENYIKSLSGNFLIEKWERTRSPLPTSSIRVLTFNAAGKSQLLSAAFLPAPDGSISTAYFDLDTYRVDFKYNKIGKPIRYKSDGKYTGLEIPELSSIAATCLELHNNLSEHIEISWDIILTERGPVYLEGNVFPPGCDYKLSIFKCDENIQFVKNQILRRV